MADAVAAAAACVSHCIQAAPGSLLQRLNALQRGAQLGCERDTRCIGHRAALQLNRPACRLVGAYDDVLQVQVANWSIETVVASWCVVIARPTLERHIAEDPAFAFELLNKVIRRARAATLSLRTIAFNDVYGRVVWLLNSRAVARPGGSRVVGPISQREIAEWLAGNRSMVSRVMTAREDKSVVLIRALPTRF